MSDLKDLKERILDEIPLSQLIGQYIPLTRKGTANMALCPFHDDRNPSMSVSDEKKIFKCFSCGEGGNAIDFVVKYKRLDFISALKEICQQNSIDFDQYVKKKKLDPKTEMAARILTKVTQLYMKNARGAGKETYSEFLSRRDLTPETAETYQLGLAPKGNAVTHYLSSIPHPSDRDFALQIAQEIGLIKIDKYRKEENGKRSYYDTFRERLIFPIWNHSGKVIGYTSRSLREEQKPKYMNSSESFMYNKAQILYGLHLARNSIREQNTVLLVEGNMDQIALYQRGFHNAVAIMGTAFGPYHLSLLRPMAQNFIFAFDTDDGGHQAAIRANKLCLQEKILAKCLDFGHHKDPDEFLKNEGILALEKLISEAPLFIDKELEALIPTPLPSILDQKLALLQKAFELLAPLEEDLLATERILAFAKRLHLQSQPEMILKQYQEFIANFKANSREAAPIALPALEEVMTEEFNENEEASPLDEGHLRALLSAPRPISRAEKLFIQNFVAYPELSTHSNFSELLDFLQSNEVQTYVWRLIDLTYEVDENEYARVVHTLNQKSDVANDIKEAVSRGLATYQRENKGLKKHRDHVFISRLYGDLKKQLELDQLRGQREDILAKRETCQTQEELNQLLLELSQIDKKLSELKKYKTTDFQGRL